MNNNPDGDTQPDPEPKKRGRGRPRVADKLTPAQRAKRYRDKKRLAGANKSDSAKYKYDVLKKQICKLQVEIGQHEETARRTAAQRKRARTKVNRLKSEIDYLRRVV